jgi:nucleosome binding factor SPN SPT16 subunit
MRLHKLKLRDLKLRYDRGEIQSTKTKKKVKVMDTIQSYRSIKEYPKELQPGKIFVDVKRQTVLIPNTPNTWIPVHIGTIKSVSDTV